MFSEKLKTLRKQRGITQEQLAKDLGIGTSTIGMYESNIRKPSYAVLKQISIYFNVSVDYLVNDSEHDDSFNLDFFIENIQELSPEEREKVLDFISFLKEKYHK